MPDVIDELRKQAERDARFRACSSIKIAPSHDSYYQVIETLNLLVAWARAEGFTPELGRRLQNSQLEDAEQKIFTERFEELKQQSAEVKARNQANVSRFCMLFNCEISLFGKTKTIESRKDWLKDLKFTNEETKETVTVKPIDFIQDINLVSLPDFRSESKKFDQAVYETYNDTSFERVLKDRRFSIFLKWRVA